MEFNNREIALSIYLAIAITWGLSKGSIRSSVVNVLKTFFQSKFQILFEVHLVYFLLILIMLSYLGFWEASLLKSTILWLLFSSISLIMNVIKESKNDGFFKKLIISNFQIAVLVEYTINLIVFELYIELILQFVLFFLFLMITGSKQERKFAKATSFFNGVLGILILTILLITIYNMVVGYQNYFTILNLKELLLPAILTILYIPFLYTIALYTRYEIYFVKIDHLNKEKPLNSYVKRKLLFFTNLSLKKLNKFSRHHPFIEYETKDDIDKIFQNYGITSKSTRPHR